MNRVLQSKYIRRFLFAINKCRLPASGIPFQCLFEDFGYKIIHQRFKFVIHQIIAIKSKQYIHKNIYTINSQLTFEYINKTNQLLHAIILPKNARCELQINNIWIDKYYTQSTHFQSPLPIALLNKVTVSIKINDNAKTVNVITYTSLVSPDSISRNELYYWHAYNKAEPIHAWRIHNGELIRPYSSICVSGCLCKDTIPLKWNDLNEYHVKQSLLT